MREWAKLLAAVLLLPVLTLIVVSFAHRYFEAVPERMAALEYRLQLNEEWADTLTANLWRAEQANQALKDSIAVLFDHHWQHALDCAGSVDR